MRKSMTCIRCPLSAYKLENSTYMVPWYSIWDTCGNLVVRLLWDASKKRFAPSSSTCFGSECVCTHVSGSLSAQSTLYDGDSVMRVARFTWHPHLGGTERKVCTCLDALLSPSLSHTFYLAFSGRSMLSGIHQSLH